LTDETMNGPKPSAAFISALTTEHFVLQTAASSTIAEAGVRSSLYVFAVSSSLVAMGFVAQLPGVFLPFVAAVLPAVFLMGLMTVVRLVDLILENQQYLAGIARIRSRYRSLGPEAAQSFAPAYGRWPEAAEVPSLRHGPLIATLGTTATMVAFINSVIGGAGVALLLASVFGQGRRFLAVGGGVSAAVVLSAVFVVYQQWRMSGIPAMQRDSHQ
jgi:hypothetical protein